MNICIYFVWFSMYMYRTFGLTVPCAHDMHFRKCVYTPLSLNPYTSTLCCCHSRIYGLHFTDGEFRGNSWCVLEQGLNRFSKSWGRYNLSPCCISEYIRRQFRSTDIGWSWTFTSSFVMLLKFLIQIKLKWSCICHHLRPVILLFLFLSQLPLSVFW